MGTNVGTERPNAPLKKPEPAANRPEGQPAAGPLQPAGSPPKLAGDTAAFGSPTSKKPTDPQAALLTTAAPTPRTAATFDAALQQRTAGKPKPGAPGQPSRPEPSAPGAAGTPAAPAATTKPSFAWPAARPLDAVPGAQAARAKAEALRDTLKGKEKTNTNPEDGPLGTTIHRDLMHAQEKDTPAQQAEARQQLEANQAGEQQARDKMTPEQQQQYDQLSKSLEKDPMTRLSLQTLAMEGKLTGGEPSRDGGTLLGELAKMNDPANPIAGSINREQLVRSVINETAFPESIAQRDKSTCAPTTVQTMLAQKNPAEYARLVNGLAGTDDPSQLAPGQKPGQVIGPDGTPLQRPKGGARFDKSDRSPSSQLLQGAFMEKANGAMRYDAKKDVSVDRKGKADDGGLDNRQTDKLMKAIFPTARHEAKDLTTIKNEKAREAVAQQHLARIAERAQAGTPTPVGAKWDAKDKRGTAHDEHAVLVTKVTGDRVHYTNPWGHEESMPRAEFARRMIDVNHADF